jgi:putative ABC transport system permease protein
MKKTQRKDAIRNIKKRIVSFLSVCLVVALGLGALFTTRYTAAGLDKEYSAYYNARNFKDFELIASLGVSESSLEKIRSVEGVTAAEGVMLADGVISFGDKNRNAVVSSVTKEVSVPELTDGSLPSGREECMIGEDFAELEGLKTGDRIGITLSGMDALGDEQPLYKKEFTITGLMHNPEQFKRMSVNTVALPIEAFNEEATNGLYTEAYVRIEEP